MTEIGQTIAQLSIASLLERGSLKKFDNPLYGILVELIEGDIDCEVQEYLEYEISDDELTFYFAIYYHEKHSDWNVQRTPYAWVAIDKDLDVAVDMDFTKYFKL